MDGAEYIELPGSTYGGSWLGSHQSGKSYFDLRQDNDSPTGYRPQQDKNTISKFDGTDTNYNQANFWKSDSNRGEWEQMSGYTESYPGIKNGGDATNGYIRWMGCPHDKHGGSNKTSGLTDEASGAATFYFVEPVENLQFRYGISDQNNFAYLGKSTTTLLDFSRFSLATQR